MRKLNFISKNRNSEEIKQKVENEGKIVILDRYCYSGAVYSMSNGLSMDWCKSADSGLPKPDVVVFLNIVAESTAKRAEFGNEIYEKVDFQKKVYENYLKLVEEKNWVLVEADREFELVKEDVIGVVEERFLEFEGSGGGCELGKVWV